MLKVVLIFLSISILFFLNSCSFSPESGNYRIPVREQSQTDPVLEVYRLTELGERHMQRGEFLEASIYFQRAIGFDFYNPEPHILLAACYYQMGWYHLASFELNRTVELFNSPEWRGLIFYYSGLSYERQGKYKQAYSRYRMAANEGYESERVEAKMKKLEKQLNLDDQVDEEDVQVNRPGEKSEFETGAKPVIFFNKNFEREIKK